jgi:hypothetical protein
MSEPERPNSEDEKAVPMPLSGAARPAFRSSKITPVLAEETLRSRIVSATALTVWRRPQKVPSRPRKISRLTR